MPVGGGLLSSGSTLSNTKKQGEMARSFSPANNNEINLSGESATQDKQGVLSSQEQQSALQQTKNMGQLQNQQKTTQAAGAISQVGQLQANLGSFNTRLLAQTNAFLNGETASGVNATLASGGTPVYDPNTGTWTAPDAKTNLDLSGITNEKLQQQQDLKNTASPYFDENGNAKSFDEVLAKFADQNNDGVLDQQEKAWANDATNIANLLVRMQNTQPGSAEYQAIMMQLSSLDKNGMASGVLSALNQYEGITGMRVAGADADTYYLRDLLKMNRQQVEDELGKAVTASTGLFGADYSAYVKEEADKSQRQYTQAGREDATVMQQLKSTAQTWLNNWETQFSSARDQLNSMFKGATDKLVADLDAAAKESKDKGIEQAKQWFVDTQTLTTQGGKDFSKVIFNALTDSSLGAEPKAILRKWLTQTIGDDAAGQGILANLLNKVSSSGYFWTQNADGQNVQVSFTPAQKMEVVRMMNDSSKTDSEKADALQKIIEDASQGMSGQLKTDINKVIEPIQSGSLEKGLNAWEGAMNQSMQGFGGSLVQTGYTAAVQSIGRGNPPAVMQQAIEQKAQEKIDEINTAYDAAKQAILDTKAKIDADIPTIQSNIIQAQGLGERGAANVVGSYQSALSTYTNTAMQKTATNDPVTGTTHDMSRLEIEWRNAQKAQNLEISNADLAKLQPPSDINSPKYANLYASLAMMRNLRDLKSPEYDIIMRDYLGEYASNRSAIDMALDHPGMIFLTAKPGQINPTAIAAKIYSAFNSQTFGQSVWNQSKNAQAVNSNIANNQKYLEGAKAKQAEITTALAKLDSTMAQTQASINAQKQKALDQASVAIQQIPQGQVVTPSAPTMGTNGLMTTNPSMQGLAPVGAQAPGLIQTPNYGGNGGYTLAQLDEIRNANIRNQQIQYDYEQQQAALRDQWGQWSAQHGGGGSSPVTSVPMTQRPDANIPLNIYTGGAPSQQMNAGSVTTGAAPTGGHITADISQETANNMFNKAIGGQTMDFTRMPEVDIQALRNIGNVQYTPGGSSGMTEGIVQMATPDFTPGAVDIATGRPIKDVGGEPTANKPIISPTSVPTQEQTLAPPTSIQTENVNRERRNPSEVPNTATITPTSTQNTNVVTANGKQTLANMPGGTLLDPQGAISPDLPPAGTAPGTDQWPAPSQLPGAKPLEKEPEAPKAPPISFGGDMLAAMGVQQSKEEYAKEKTAWEERVKDIQLRNEAQTAGESQIPLEQLSPDIRDESTIYNQIYNAAVEASLQKDAEKRKAEWAAKGGYLPGYSPGGVSPDGSGNKYGGGDPGAHQTVGSYAGQGPEDRRGDPNRAEA